MTDIDFSKHDKVLAMVKESQSNERDQRQKVRDARLFLNKRDGQWDPYAWQKLDGRFRGTFDMCTPIVDGISGEVDQSDFTLKVSPSGGKASMDTAKTIDGLIRNIRNISNADQIFSKASRNNVIGGFDCWEVLQEWVDADAFDQDLMIKYVPNAVDSVWFDINSMKQDRSDAKWGVKLIKKSKAEYDSLWPKGSGQSVSDSTQAVAYYSRPDFVTVGQLYYRKKRNIELAQMSDGSVYKVDDDYNKVKDELKAQGITEQDRRTRKSWRVYSRLFDGGEFLNEEEETVFDYIPLIPLYGNFDIFENQPIYHGKLENLFDPQRVLNYAMSRDIEDGALSPSQSIWMTEKQAQGHDYSEMNTDGDPVRFYNPDEQAPPISQASLVGGAMVNQGLQATIALTKELITSSSNSFNALQGNAMPMQSGIAGAQQIEQANIGSIKWFEALKTAICHTGKVLINAIPRVYDSTRQVRILEEDGSSSIVPLNQPTLDTQTQQIITLNDLSIGEYDVVCDFGPAFNSQQKETAQAFLDMATIDPSFLQTGKDIMLKNMSVPGMDQMAERARVELLNAGMIPEEQLTDEERQKIQEAQAAAAQQPPPEDPMMVAARAEEIKGQADMISAQTKQQVEMANVQLKDKALNIDMAKVQLQQQEFERASSDKFNVEAAKISQGQEQLDLDRQKQEFDQRLAVMQQQMDEMTASVNNLKTLREAMGVDAIVGPGNTEAYKDQAQIVQSKQDESE